MNVIELLDNIRKERGMSCYRMAQNIDEVLRPSQISNIFAKKADVKASTLVLLCKALGIDLVQLLKGENDVAI